mmetsp:Transcript_13565/g.24320  ORF Transcript_13565/g.24320 Transcript_13565/m.24320 type:complete len:123 (-) Transcript_13565:1194-1562(-)
MDIFFEERGYEQSLCGCLGGNVIDSVYTYCCCPCSFGEWYGRRRGKDDCVVNSLIGTVIGMCVYVAWFFVWQERKKAQDEYGIQNESAPVAIFLSICCSCCVIAQERAQYNAKVGEPKLLFY